MILRLRSGESSVKVKMADAIDGLCFYSCPKNAFFIATLEVGYQLNAFTCKTKSRASVPDFR